MKQHFTLLRVSCAEQSRVWAISRECRVKCDDLFLVYLMEMSEAQTLWCPTVGSRVSSEYERMWKEAGHSMITFFVKWELEKSQNLSSWQSVARFEAGIFKIPSLRKAVTTWLRHLDQKDATRSDLLYSFPLLPTPSLSILPRFSPGIQTTLFRDTMTQLIHPLPP